MDTNAHNGNPVIDLSLIEENIVKEVPNSESINSNNSSSNNSNSINSTNVDKKLKSSNDSLTLLANFNLISLGLNDKYIRMWKVKKILQYGIEKFETEGLKLDLNMNNADLKAKSKI